jgi:hypothetical protein
MEAAALPGSALAESISTAIEEVFDASRDCWVAADALRGYLGEGELVGITVVDAVVHVGLQVKGCIIDRFGLWAPDNLREQVAAHTDLESFFGDADDDASWWKCGPDDFLLEPVDEARLHDERMPRPVMIRARRLITRLERRLPAAGVRTALESGITVPTRDLLQKTHDLDGSAVCLD